MVYSPAASMFVLGLVRRGPVSPMRTADPVDSNSGIQVGKEVVQIPFENDIFRPYKAETGSVALGYRRRHIGGYLRL